MSPIEFFNTNIKNKYWSSNKDLYKKWFKKQLKHLLIEIEDNTNEEDLKAFMYRLGLGYWGIGKQNGISSGLRTKQSYFGKTIKDHVFGTVEIGKYIHQEFEKHNRDINYMVEEWLYENLWLWITIKVSKNEHKKENIERNLHTIEEKKELKHYKNVSELVEDTRKIFS